MNKHFMMLAALMASMGAGANAGAIVTNQLDDIKAQPVIDNVPDVKLPEYRKSGGGYCYGGVGMSPKDYGEYLLKSGQYTKNKLKRKLIKK